MFDSFLEAIGRIGIFMICARAIVHFRPKEADEKYMKLLVSIMVLIQLFLPLGEILMGGSSETIAALEQFKVTLEQSMQEADQYAESAEALLEEMTLEEVRRRAKERKIEVDDHSEVTVEIKVKPVDSISVGGEVSKRE